MIESKPIRILYMEDDAGIACLVKKNLEREGFVVDSATNGCEGLSLYEKSAYSIIIVDCHMPEMVGIDVIRNLGRRGHLPPTIMVTGTGNESLAVEAMKLGADDYIIKDANLRFLALLPIVVRETLAKRLLAEEKRQALNSMRESEARHREILDLIPDTVYRLDRNGFFTYLSPGAAKLGYAPQHLLGKHFSEIVHPDDRESACYRFNERRTGARGTHNFTIRIKSSKGTTKDCELTDIPITLHSFGMYENPSSAAARFIGTQGIIRDISETKRSEQILREITSRYQAILNTIPDILAEVDVNKVYTWANPAAYEFFGEDIIGKEAKFYFADGLLPAEEQNTYELVQPLFTGEKNVIRVESLQRRKDGETRLLAWLCVALRDANGDITGALSTSRDITERRLMEKELIKYKEHLEELVSIRTAELKNTHIQLLHAAKLSATGKLAACIAHEFNNPIYGIRNVLEQIGEKAPLDENDKSLVSLAVRECNRISGLIRKLQDMNRPSGGIPSLVNIHSAIDDMILLNQTLFKERKIEVVKNYAPDITSIFAIDDQIKQVLLNLIQNAEEAIPETGGRITLATQINGENIIIKIQDTGQGIPPDIINSIFEPFFTTKPAVKGTGLGLSVSYGIIKGHGGHIEVDSIPGKETTFTIMLPTKREIP